MAPFCDNAAEAIEITNMIGLIMLNLTVTTSRIAALNLNANRIPYIKSSNQLAHTMTHAVRTGAFDSVMSKLVCVISMHQLKG